VADLLRKEPDTQVEVVDGGRGEFTVTVDGREVARKGESLPDPGQIVAAVRGGHSAGTGR
jgi:hypothetical protein